MLRTPCSGAYRTLCRACSSWHQNLLPCCPVCPGTKTCCPAALFALSVLQRRRTEAEAALAAAKDDLRHMTEELIEAQVGAMYRCRAAAGQFQEASGICPRLFVVYAGTACCQSRLSSDVNHIAASLPRALACSLHMQEAADSLLHQLEDDLHTAARSVEEATRQVGAVLVTVD